MDARFYLNQIEKIDRLIQNKKYERDQWMAVAEGTSMTANGERVQSSGPMHKMENAVIKIVEVDESIKALEDKKQEIIKTIELLNAESYDILHKKYVQYMNLEEVGTILGYSWSTIKRKHKEAIRRLQIILNEKEIEDE